MRVEFQRTTQLAPNRSVESTGRVALAAKGVSASCRHNVAKPLLRTQAEGLPEISRCVEDHRKPRHADARRKACQSRSPASKRLNSRVSAPLAPQGSVGILPTQQLRSLCFARKPKACQRIAGASKTTG